MEVILAGFNLDASQLKDNDVKLIPTPETISAAYARISRSSLPVDSLRNEALLDVKKARSSNETIVFEMGHSSVAEHAVFNFDVIGISRLLVETVQRSRIASFTEKSQRYVTLKGDFHLPQEIKGTYLENEYIRIIEKQNSLYRSLYEEAYKYLIKKQIQIPKREIRSKAKEDARYVLALATETQFGMTINARSLERLLQRLDKNPLLEAQELKEKLETQARKIAPSLVRYTCCENFEKDISDKIPHLQIQSENQTVTLLDYTSLGEERILAALLLEEYGTDRISAEKWIKAQKPETIDQIYHNIFQNIEAWQKLPRAFEMADVEFKISCSSSCFGQLKRHRIATILRSPYSPKFGYILPSQLQITSSYPNINPLMKEVEDMYYKLEKMKKGLGNYILTNAHKINVLFKANLRELYHFSRLRSDIHAQWEIRNISKEIDAIMKKIYPRAAMFMMGKHELNKRE